MTNAPITNPTDAAVVHRARRLCRHLMPSTIATIKRLIDTPPPKASSVAQDASQRKDGG